MSSSSGMIPSPLRPRRHVRRTSNQRQLGPQPAPPAAVAHRRDAVPQRSRVPRPQTPTPPRRRNLYHPPASTSTHHANVRHLHEELRDLTQNLAHVQRRIQQLETVEHTSVSDAEEDASEDDRPLSSPPRPQSVVYRLPELSLDSDSDFARFGLEGYDFLHASAPAAPRSDEAPESIESVNEDLPTPSTGSIQPTHGTTHRASQRKSHYRDESVATVKSFASYNTEAVQVCEASTAAFIRPNVRQLPQRRPEPLLPQRVRINAPAHGPNVDAGDCHGKERLCNPSAHVANYPRRVSSRPRVDSSTVPADEIKQARESSTTLDTGSTRPNEQRGSKWQPVRFPMTLDSRAQAETPATPSTGWETESHYSEETPCSTALAGQHDCPASSPVVTHNHLSTPFSSDPPRWLNSSPPPTEEPHLDSTCTSITEASTPKRVGRPRTPLNLFPKIQQSSCDSLPQRLRSAYSDDPFYEDYPEQNGCEEWMSSPSPAEAPASSIVTERASTRQSTGQELSLAALDRPKRKDYRLRGFLSPGVRRQQRESSNHAAFVRSPRRKLRTFLRRFTPTTGKLRHSMPAQSSEVNAWQSPPRLPTRRGSTLPFDESLLGELTKISSRREPSAAPSPARRVRNSMHDAAGLTLSKTAATHAHWRAQRSRSSIMLSSVHLRSRAPTGSTMSSGPSFYFLPKVDQLPVTPMKRGPVGRQRLTRY